MRAVDLLDSDRAGGSYCCLSCDAAVYLAAYLRPAEQRKQQPHFRLKKGQAHKAGCTVACGPPQPGGAGASAVAGGAIEILDLRLVEPPGPRAPVDPAPPNTGAEPQGGQGGGQRTTSLRRICQAHFNRTVAFDAPLRIVGVTGLADTTISEVFRPLSFELGVGTRIWFGGIFENDPPFLKGAPGLVRLNGSDRSGRHRVFKVCLNWEGWSAQARNRLARDLRQAFASTGRLRRLRRESSSPVQERHPRVYFIGHPPATDRREFDISDPRYICVIQGSDDDGETEIELRRD